MADDEHHSLAALGLSPETEDVYRALLALPRADVGTLACRLDLAEAAVARPLSRLLDLDLARMVTDAEYAANPPELSIVALLGERVDRLSRTYAAVAPLERLFRHTRRHGDDAAAGDVGTETVTGLTAIRSRLDQLNARARDEVRMFMRHPLITTDAGGSVRDPAPNPRARYRTLYEKPLLDDSAVVELIRRSVERGFQVRFAATLPVKLAIADEELALIMQPGTHPVALLTEHPALVAMAAGLFEQVWSTAVPAPALDDESPPGMAYTGGPSDPDDRLLLSLLLAGLTDQTIAARLGVGLRTVQRRVRDLMDAANVDTRIQLGWQASRKGWI